MAGLDHIAASGRLVLYPGETFYLDVTNPVGGSFGAGVVKLTAVRTILNDDLL